MEITAKIAAIAILTAVLCVLVRDHEKTLAVLLSLAACIGILLLGLRFLSPVWSVVEQLERLSGLSDVVTTPLLKVAGIGLLTQVASGVCTDAGESALAKIVEISGAVLAVYTSLPLLSSVLGLLEELLGGSG